MIVQKALAAFRGVHSPGGDDPRTHESLLSPSEQKPGAHTGQWETRVHPRKCPRAVEQARRRAGEYIERDNTQRLHAAIGYRTPLHVLDGRQTEIHAERARTLEAARQIRRHRRQLNPLSVAV